MEQHNTANEQKPPVRGKPFTPGTSGNPEGARTKSRRFKELFATLAADFGGPSALSGLRSVALSQAVRLLVKAERPRLDQSSPIARRGC
jgi:hypothetical protein